MAQIREENKIALNHLPSLTWFRLGVNHTLAAAPGVDGIGAYTESPLPEGVTAAWIDTKMAYAQADLMAGPILREQYVAGKSYIYQEQKLATGMGEDFENLMKKSTQQTRVYYVDENVKVAEPILIDLKLSAGNNLASTQIIELADGAEASFVFHYSSNEYAYGTLSTQTKVVLGKGAVLHLSKISMIGNHAVLMDDTGALEGENAHLDFVHMLLGGKKTYAGCASDQRGRGCIFEVNSGYMAQADHLMDLNYNAVQRGQKTQSSFQVKGVLSDCAQKVFRGTIDFRSGSVGSAGDEQEDVLLLDPDVINKTMPVILCEEEDVDGRHGATIGRLSQDMLFYLESRGIPEEVAQRMMVLGRLSSIARRVPVTRIRKQITAFVEKEFGSED